MRWSKFNFIAFIIMVCSSLMYTPNARSQTNYGDKEAVLIRVYDGDSLTVNIPDWPGIIGKSIGVRVSGVDTPEMSGKCEAEKTLALAAKQFTKNFVASKNITLKNIMRDKYFRIDADIYVDGKSLSSALLENNLAYPYFGKTKKYPWCVTP